MKDINHSDSNVAEYDAKIMTLADFGKKEENHEDGDKEISPVMFSLCVRALRQNWRQGTVACKGRSDVSFSNKKPWKQKGTGRARVGSRRSPLWRKGGIIFGPQARSKTLKVSKMVKKNVMEALAYQKIRSGKVAMLDGYFVAEHEMPKTALMHKLLKAVNLAHARINFFVDIHDYMTQASCANLPLVSLYTFDEPNVYALSQGEYWVFLKKDEHLFKKMVNAWI